jgi:Tol biopolymer transport system component
MSLANGSRLGPYEILSPLGAGGMGEVYRARDTRLGRDVAIKVLPSHLSADPARRDRFEREARAVGSLNHPHICTLHDIGRQETPQGAIDYLVMEHLEGETLADRLARGPLPVEQALEHATAIADALDRAHRKGVVHRDLKPGNIMLTPAGAKLLDFGLAKLHEGGAAGAAAAGGRGGSGAGGSILATTTRNLTAEGAILGTFQYMAPEQLEGKEADPRTDIFAFGVVVYEMLTGRKAFTGDSQASLIAAIMERDPAPMAPLAPLSPPALERVVRTCLAKNPDDRWQSARDLAREIRWIGDGGDIGRGGPGAGAAPGAQRIVAATARRVLAWKLAATVLAAMVVVLGVLIARRAPVETRRVRLSFAHPFGDPYDAFSQAAVSPDGRRVVFVASTADGKSILQVRPLDALAGQPLPGTEGGVSPFWSPDSRFIAFFADRRLKKIAADGGPPQPLCDAPGPVGPGAWNRDGVILFEPGGVDPLYRVAATGGAPVQVTRLAPREEAHRFPSFLPDGRHFVFLADANQTEDHKLRIGSLDSQETRVLVGAISNVHFALPGYLLFVRAGSLIAQPFDAARGELAGEPVALVDGLAIAGLNHRFEFSVSDNGELLYRSVNPDAQLAWFDRGGHRLGNVGEPGRFDAFQVSPDTRRVALAMNDADGRNSDIWILDIVRGQRSRFTFDPTGDWGPMWSPDGEKIVWLSQRKGLPMLFENTLTHQGEDESLPAQGDDMQSGGWAPDGRHVIFSTISARTGWDLFTIRPDGKEKPEPYLVTPFNEVDGRFSPDGRQVAYASDASGQMEIYVRSFPASAAGRQISTGGGSHPHWRLDGRELYFTSPAGGVMAAAVRGGPAFDVDPPRELFRIAGLLDFAPAGDGERFLVGTYLQETQTAPMTVELNWQAGLKKP